MLTASQTVHYGYKSVHDLPTPPSTSRLSPPLAAVQDHSRNTYASVPRSHSPPEQQMSAPHRGLPPPAALALPPQHQHQHQHQPQHPQHHHQQQPQHQPTQPQQPSLAGGAPPPPPPPPPPPSATAAPPPLATSSSHREALSQLPGPPPQWQGAEDSMRSWLNAKAEEERRKQEEERTKQETLKLEQRRIEAEMLRTSLGGGIPPPVVPLVFAGMGGSVSPTALEMAQQYLNSQGQAQHPQLLAPQRQRSPDHRRDSVSYPYPSVPPSTPGSAPAPHGYLTYPGSPTSRGRAQTLSSSGSANRPLPALGVGGAQPGQPGAPAGQGHSGQHPTSQPASSQSDPSQQQQQSPGIYFHHWQPPTSQGGSSNQTTTPSGESPRNKRKATGVHQPAPLPSQHQFRSPPPLQSAPSQGEPGGERRKHTRQRSDLSGYRSAVRSRGGSLGPMRDTSPQASSSGVSRESEPNQSQYSIQQQQPRGAGGHSVSSMLTGETAHPSLYHSTASSEVPRHHSQAPEYREEGRR